ncbi:MAG: hypothetical protein Q8K70_06600 [Bacteroidota bacterium]|nr:hypothetical protein [Bacteroidota bacterium]
MTILNPKLVVNVYFSLIKAKLTNFVKIILIAIFLTSCSKTPIPTPIPNYEGIYLGDIFQNGPHGVKDHKYEKNNIKVFDSKLNFYVFHHSSQFMEEKIVRFDLSGSNFSIIPDTTDGYNVRRIITGNGSFKNKELTIEWREMFIYPNRENDTANFKGNLKR